MRREDEERNPPSREWYEARLMDTFGVDEATASAMYDYVDELVDARPLLADFADYADDLVAEFIDDDSEPEFDDMDYWLDYGDEIEESASAYTDEQ